MAENQKQERFVCQGYDITLAVQAIRLLKFDATSNDDCDKFVWQPARQLLNELSENQPKSVLCFHDAPRKIAGAGGRASNVYIVGPQKRVVHLGSVLDNKGARNWFDFYIKRLPQFSKRKLELKKQGSLAINQHFIICSIPSDSERLDDTAIMAGIKKYLKKYAPPLANVPAHWLPKQACDLLNHRIWEIAQKTAKHQTKQEREEIFKQNFLQDIEFKESLSFPAN